MLKTKQAKIIFGGTLGTILEWMEFSLYAYMAMTISGLFFPDTQPFLKQYGGYGIFAAGFIMRPLGGVALGILGDRLGRKPALRLTVAGMGVSTMLIGCLPTYHHWGIWAPISLVILRMMQGLAIGGEYAGAGIYLSEHAPKNKAYFWGSFVSAASAFGIVIGAALVAIISHPSMPEYAWRWPFIATGVANFWLYWSRRNFIETPAFLEQNVKKSSLATMMRLLFTYRTGMIRVMAIAAIVGIYYYISSVFWVGFLVRQTGFSPQKATWLAVLGQSFVTLFIPLLGAYADKIQNGYKVMRAGLLAAAFYLPIHFAISLYHPTMPFIIMGLLGYALINAAITGPMIHLMTHFFPVSIRLTGTAFAWNISVAIFSGTAPMVAAALAWQFHPLLPGVYVSLAALLARCLIPKQQTSYAVT